MLWDHPLSLGRLPFFWEAPVHNVRFSLRCFVPVVPAAIMTSVLALSITGTPGSPNATTTIDGCLIYQYTQ